MCLGNPDEWTTRMSRTLKIIGATSPTGVSRLEECVWITANIRYWGSVYRTELSALSICEMYSDEWVTVIR